MFVVVMLTCVLQSGKEKRLDPKVASALGEEEKMSSKYLRANTHVIRAKR